MLIVGIILCILSGFVAFIKDKDGSLAFVACGLILGGMFIGICLNDNEIEPIDVYRGKTTLEITYKDGVAIDSVVVFKDKEN